MTINGPDPDFFKTYEWGFVSIAAIVLLVPSLGLVAWAIVSSIIDEIKGRQK